MNISVKGEYALHAMFDLALQKPGEPIKIADIARRQKIPQKFLELILAGLKQGGFVESRRGAEGGYLLARPPDAITIGEVVQFMEGGKAKKPAQKHAMVDPFAETWGRGGPGDLRYPRPDDTGRTGSKLARQADQVRAQLGDLMLFQDNSLSIGRTPLVKLNRVTDGAHATVLAKIEGRNPAYSVKDRIGASMIWDAEKRGVLGPGKELIEPTSGNTGIALAFVAAARGYAITLIMPETMSVERRKVLRAFGANLILTEGSGGMRASIAKAEEMVASDPDRFVLLQQFQNPANPEIHFKTSGPEIWEDTEGAIDVLVSGVGTGGTITGVSRYIKTQKKKIVSVAVEPAVSPVITQTLKGEPLRAGPHQDTGNRCGVHSRNLGSNVVDRVELVSDEESIEMARRLAREEGILSGISSGAAVSAAVRIAKEPEMKGKTLVVVLPDSGERYLSTLLFKGISAE